jgi:hypothetical protein
MREDLGNEGKIILEQILRKIGGKVVRLGYDVLD